MKLKNVSAIAMATTLIWISCTKENADQLKSSSSGTPLISVFSVTGIPGDTSSEIKKEYSKHVDVFGVDVYGTMDANNEQLLHTANMLGEFLDNDEDGVADNQNVVDQLIASGEFLSVFGYDDCPDMQDDDMDEDEDDEEWEEYDDDDLVFSEPEVDCDYEMDPLFQEVFDYVYMYGICNIYNDELGLNNDAEIGDWIDECIADGLYEMDEMGDTDVMDEMGYGMLYCDFLFSTYLCYMDMIGCADEEISDGISLTNRNDVDENLPDLYKILGNQSYGFPNRLPDGIYHP